MSEKTAMESLTKENFWNDLKDKFPEQVQQFCDWVDNYKLKGVWVNTIKPGVKFHDLPIEMQVGILGRFFREVGKFQEFDPNIAQRDAIASAVRHRFWIMYYEKESSSESTDPAGDDFVGNGTADDSLDYGPKNPK